MNQDIEDFDFIALQNWLQSIVQDRGTDIVSPGDIKKSIENLCMQWGWWTESFYFTDHGMRKRYFGGSTPIRSKQKEYYKWRAEEPRLALIEGVFEVGEQAGLYEWYSSEKKHGYRDIKYKVLDDRSTVQIVQDLYEDLDPQDAVLITQMMNEQGLHESVRLFRKIKRCKCS